MIARTSSFLSQNPGYLESEEYVIIAHKQRNRYTNALSQRNWYTILISGKNWNTPYTKVYI